MIVIKPVFGTQFAVRPILDKVITMSALLSLQDNCCYGGGKSQTINQ